MKNEGTALGGTILKAVLTAATLALGAPAVASAKTPGNAIEAIETKKSATGRDVIIRTKKAPTFSVFRLSDPFRVLVDVSDARASGRQQLERFDGDGMLRYISTHNFSDELSTLARVEIALENEAAYDVKAEGNAIVVKLTGSGAPQPVKAEAAPAPAPVEPSSKLGKLDKRVQGKTLILSLPIEGDSPSPAAVAIQQLEDPSRLVIDISGATSEPKWQKLPVKHGAIERARVGVHDTGVRIVLDVKKNATLPEVSVEAEGKKLLIKCSPPKAEPPAVAVAEAAPKAEPPAPVIEPAPVEQPVAAKAEPKTSGSVTDVKFEQKDGFVRLSVELKGEVNPVKDGASTRLLPMLRIAGAALPEELVRTLDTTAVAGKVVSAVSTYREGNDTVIAANVGVDTEHRHWRKGNVLYWDFRGKEGAAPEQARVVEYPTVATAGYQSQDAARLGLAAAEQRRSRYSGRRISLDLKDADIQNVLRLLADVSKLNIVASDDVKGKITLKLRNVPWDQALDIILQSKQLDKVRNGNIIRVAPIDVLEKEAQLRILRQEANQKLEPLSVRLIPVSYAVARDIQPQVSALLSQRGKVNIDTRTNVLVVEDIAEVLLKVERLVRTLDTQTPQVLIEARIVQAISSFGRELGIQWGGQVNASPQFGTATGLGFPNTIRIAGGSDDQATPTGGTLSDPSFAVNLPATVGSGAGGSLGFVFGSAGGSALLALRLSAAETEGKTKIISSPKVVTLDNKQAKILSGEKIPITVLTANGPSTRFIDANLELEVTPHVTSDGSILMSINASQNQLSDRVDVLGTPGIITREAKTEMLVKDGDTAVLGGIYQRTAAETKNYVPFFGDIPVLGWLFKTTNRTDARDELLIFISPRIVNRSEALVQNQ